ATDLGDERLEVDLRRASIAAREGELAEDEAAIPFTRTVVLQLVVGDVELRRVVAGGVLGERELTAHERLRAPRRRDRGLERDARLVGVARCVEERAERRESKRDAAPVGEP